MTREQRAPRDTYVKWHDAQNHLRSYAMEQDTTALRPASEEELLDLVDTTQMLLAAFNAPSGVYELWEAGDHVWFGHKDRIFIDGMKDANSLLGALFSGISFAAMGSYLADIPHTNPTAHTRIAAHHALHQRAMAAGPHATSLLSSVQSASGLNTHS